MSKIDKCLNSEHDLIAVHVSGYEDEPCTVVRWCRICGAVVVDTDYDGRTYPGQIMKMKTPVTFQKIWKYKKENPV